VTLSTLLSDLYRRLGYASSPATEITTRLTAFVNQTQRDILSEPGMQVLLDGLDGTITFDSVASTPQYSLPPAVARLKKLYERTNDRALIGLSQDTYRTYDPDTTANTGTPTHWVDLGWSAVASQPSDASDLFVDSTAAGDTNTVYIEGYRSGGYFTSLSATMTGATAKSVKGASLITDIIEVTKFYLSAAAVGTVTLVEDAEGGTELARIPIGQTYARYKRIALWPCPSSAISYSIDYERDLQDMANANDEPVLPVRFHPLLIEGALLREMTKKDDSRYDKAARAYERMLGNLKYFTFTNLDHRPVMGNALVRRPSQLGGQYPSGS
jgi:hypothetical protein